MRASGSHLPRVEQPGEEQGVRAGGQRREALPDGLEDGPGEVARVEAGQGDQEEVERVAHLAGAKDEAEGMKEEMCHDLSYFSVFRVSDRTFKWGMPCG